MRHLATNTIICATLAACGPVQSGEQLPHDTGGKADQSGFGLGFVCGGFTDRCPAMMYCPAGEDERPCALCPIPMCAAPPPGCRYVDTGLTDESGCESGCGELLCDDADGSPVCGVFSDRCPEGMVCPDGTAERKCAPCPIPMCAAPPPGCSYSGAMAVGADGCENGCGELVCNDADGSPLCGGFSGCPAGMICPDGAGERKCAPCPIPMCAAPPPGCSYVGTAATDASGCANGCGELLCQSSTPER